MKKLCFIALFIVIFGILFAKDDEQQISFSDYLRKYPPPRREPVTQYDPSLLYDQFLKDASREDFSNIQLTSYIIQRQGDAELKKKYIALLEKYKEKGTRKECSFELGKILVNESLESSQKGLDFIKTSAGAGYSRAFEFLVSYYHKKKNFDKCNQWMDEWSKKCDTPMALIIFCLENNNKEKAKKYFKCRMNQHRQFLKKVNDDRIKLSHEDKEEVIDSLKKKIQNETSIYEAKLSSVTMTKILVDKDFDSMWGQLPINIKKGKRHNDSSHQKSDRKVD